jgi:hypothetical protein
MANGARQSGNGEQVHSSTVSTKWGDVQQQAVPMLRFVHATFTDTPCLLWSAKALASGGSSLLCRTDSGYIWVQLGCPKHSVEPVSSSSLNIMARSEWSWLEKAIVIYFNQRGFLDRLLCTLLRRIANTKRTLTAVRSKLVELRKDRSLHDSRRKTWTEKATQASYGKCVSMWRSAFR